MAELLFLDSVDHYDTAHVLRKWTFGGPGGPGGPVVAGRNGNGLQISGASYPNFTFGPEYATLTVGVAYKATAFANGITFTNPLNYSEVKFLHVGDGRWRVQYLDKLTWKYSDPSTFSMHRGQWYYLEVSAVRAATTVSWEMRVNGTVILAGGDSGLWNMEDNHRFSYFAISGPGGGNNAVIDDIYCTAGEFLGDIKVSVRRPNEEGIYDDWEPDPGSDHYAMVDDVTPDDDTTHLESDTVNDQECHGLENISGLGTIKGLQTVVCVKKTDAGAGQIRTLLRSGTIDDMGDAFDPSDTSWLYDLGPHRQSPFTLNDWDEAEINELELGQERTV